MAGASRTRLAPGENSISRAKPKKNDDGSYRLQWSVALYDGRTLRRSTQGPTVSEVRRKANKVAEDLLKTGGGHWKHDARLTTYIDEVTKPALKRANLRPLTRDSYESALKMLLGDCAKCADRRDRHRYGLKQYTIGAGIRPAPLKNLLVEIAQRHGLEKVHTCRTVLNSYLITHLITDELIVGNPIAGLKVTHQSGVERAERSRGGRSMDRTEYEAFLTWLLGLDPTELVPTLKKRGWAHSREARVAKWRNAIDLSLLQMATGLRQTEARRLEWPLVHVDGTGVVSIDIPKDIAKTKEARVVLVLEPRVATRILERREQANHDGYVVGSPSDPTKMWNRSSCVAAVADLYKKAAAELNNEVLLTERSHVWRTTLRTFYSGQAPAAVLNSQFGHSQEVADKHYTDYRKLDDLAEAARLRES